MAKFLYRMQNILNIKYKLEEQAKQQYMEVRSRLNEANDVLDGFVRRKEYYMNQYRDLVSSRLEVLQIEQCKNAIIIMDEYIFNQQNIVKAIEDELERATEHMKEAMKERKIHEKLKDNQFEEFLQEINHEEALEVDQLVSYQYSNKVSAKEE